MSSTILSESLNILLEIEKKMSIEFVRQLKGWIVWTALGLALLFIGVVGIAHLGLNWYLSPERVSNWVSRSLDRPVQIKRSGFTFWSGLRLESVIIAPASKQTKKPLAEIDSLHLSPRWLPLLWGQIDLGHVRVNEPRFNMIRHEGGAWNLFSEEKPGDAASDDTALEGSRERGKQISVSEVVLKKGVIHVDDRQVSKRYRFPFESIQIDPAPGLQSVSLQLDTLRLTEGSVNGKLMIDPGKKELRIQTLDFKQLDLLKFKPYFREMIPPEMALSRLGVNGSLQGGMISPVKSQTKFKLHVDSIKGTWGNFDGSFIRKADLAGTVSHKTNDQGQLESINLVLDEVRREGIRFPGSLNMKILRPWDNPGVEGLIRAHSLSLKPFIRPELISVFPSQLQKITVEGTIDTFNLTISGRLSQPSVGGELKLSDLQFGHPDLSRPPKIESMNLHFEPDRLSLEPTTISYGGQAIDFSGTVAHPVDSNHRRVSITGTSDRFDVKSLMEWMSLSSFTIAENFTADGVFNDIRFNLEGHIPHPSWKISSNVKNVEWKFDDFPFEIGELGGHLRFTNSKLELTDLTGLADGEPFEGRIEVGFPVGPDSALDAELSMGKLKVRKILQVVPKGMIPEDLKMEGSMLVDRLGVQGTVSDPVYQVRGTSLGIEMNHPAIPHPLREVRGGFHLTDQTLSFNQLRGFYHETSFQVSGKIPIPLKAGHALTLKGKAGDVSIQTVLELTPENNLLPYISDLSGTIATPSFSFHGPLENPDYNVELSVQSVSGRAGTYLKRPISQVEGNLSVNPRRLEWSSIRGLYGGWPFQTHGKMERSDTNGTFNLVVSAPRLPAEELLPYLPENTIPDSFSIKGPLKITHLKLSGTRHYFELNGSISPEGVSLKTPFSGAPLEGISGTIDLEKSRIETKLRGKLGGKYGVNIRGEFSPRSDTSMNLLVKTETIPVEFLSKYLRHFPDFPEGWDPHGELSGEIRITGSLKAPSISGTLEAPVLGMGSLVGRNASSRVQYNENIVRMTDQKMNLLNGRVRGSMVVESGADVQQIRLNHELIEIGLGPTLNVFMDLGRGSKGKINGGIRLEGPPGKPEQFDGAVDLRGDALVFKNVPALERLNQALNQGFGQILGKGVGGLLSDILDFNPMRSKRSLEKILSSDRTTQYDRGVFSVQFQQGKGEIKRLFLRNQDLELTGRGNIWLDGRVDLQVSVLLRQNFLEKFEQDWIRNVLTGELPVITVNGTLSEPRFGTEKFEKGLLQRLLGFVGG